MRRKEILEAYLDDYHRIMFYFNKISYNGKSTKFYLKTASGMITPLEIKQVYEEEFYFVYELYVEKIEIGKTYFVEHEYARSCPLQYGLIVKTQQFNDTYAYLKDDLGATIANGTTTFKVWAPTAEKIELCIFDTYYPMKKENGVFKFSIYKELDGVAYFYRVHNAGTIKETLDPYSLKTTLNNTASIVCRKEKIIANFPTLKNYTDAIIYEASISDFTAQFEQYPRSFKGFSNDKSINYLKDLGITHLQLLPITTCGSTNDLYPNLYYNWGYDITLFLSITNRYGVLDASEEFRSLVKKLHSEDISVVLDMVFNHVHDLETSCLNILVPNYYFQITSEGEYTNNTYCGNDYDSTQIMAKKLIVDACKSWVNYYGVDGFRLDLMGILDVDTVNEIYDTCVKINPNFILYGEGWNMPTLIEEAHRATIQNQAQIPNVAFFNDYFRDILKGKTGDFQAKGYFSGEPFFGDLTKVALACSNYFNPTSSINYLECHDNLTLWDKLVLSTNESEDVLIKRMKLLLCALFVAQGVPFLHSGQEFGRSKNNLDNTYRDNSGINDFDWAKTNNALVEYTKKLIQIRKNYPQLRLSSKNIVEEKVRFSYLGEDILAYQVENLVIIFNPTSQSLNYEIAGVDLLEQKKISRLLIEAYHGYIIELEEAV